MTDNTEEALIPPRFSVGVALSFLGGDKLSTALAVFVTTKVDCTHSVKQQYTIFKEWIQNLGFGVHCNYVMFNKLVAVFYRI